MTSMIITIMGCTDNIEKKIANHIANCKTDSCKIILKDLTNFPWDTVYFFNDPTSKERVEFYVGAEYPDYQEFSHYILFKKDTKIIHWENDDTDIENMTKNSVSIDGTLPDHKYTPSNAIFLGKSNTFDNGKYYTLKQIDTK